jgi:coenzyme F420-0:L-glutamate ligase / coenzyme F420-1:gamma-L-glutamate ligase
LTGLHIRSLANLPEVLPGDDLARLIVAALAAERPAGIQSLMGAAAAAPRLRDGEIVAIAHKVVSKAEGAVVALSEVQPSARARSLAAEQNRDPRVVQVVIDQS